MIRAAGSTSPSRSTSASTSASALTSTVTSRATWLVGTLLSAFIALFSYRYVLHVGPLAPAILANPFYNPWLVIHVLGAATALLIGPVQFVPRVRARYPAWHRRTGQVYVAGCLIGGVAGFVVACGSTAGPIAKVGFGALAIAWFFTTAQAWRMALQRRFVRHRVWMIRSFALTYAAVTLRVYLLGLPLLPISPLAGYQAISFLCWIPNLLIAELYVRRNPGL